MFNHQKKYSAGYSAVFPIPMIHLDARKRFQIHVGVISYNHLLVQLQIVTEIHSIEDEDIYLLEFLDTFLYKISLGS